MKDKKEEQLLRKNLVELLKGGFAPNTDLLREFDYQKAGEILEGLHFSAWILLGHIRGRQKTILSFIKDPQNNTELWGEAYWPENHHPESQKEWEKEIDNYEKELNEVIGYIENPETPLFQIQKNDETFLGAAGILLHHTGYHIGQLKAIGRQLGVW